MHFGVLEKLTLGNFFLELRDAKKVVVFTIFFTRSRHACGTGYSIASLTFVRKAATEGSFSRPRWARNEVENACTG
jgi:hypothetical protein